MFPYQQPSVGIHQGACQTNLVALLLLRNQAWHTCMLMPEDGLTRCVHLEMRPLAALST